MKKKKTMLLLLLSFILIITACGKKNDNDNNNNGGSTVNGDLFDCKEISKIKKMNDVSKWYEKDIKFYDSEEFDWTGYQKVYYIFNELIEDTFLHCFVQDGGVVTAPTITDSGETLRWVPLRGMSAFDFSTPITEETQLELRVIDAGFDDPDFSNEGSLLIPGVDVCSPSMTSRPDNLACVIGTISRGTIKVGDAIEIIANDRVIKANVKYLSLGYGSNQKFFDEVSADDEANKNLKISIDSISVRDLYNIYAPNRTSFDSGVTTVMTVIEPGTFTAHSKFKITLLFEKPLGGVDELAIGSYKINTYASSRNPYFGVLADNIMETSEIIKSKDKSEVIITMSQKVVLEKGAWLNFNIYNDSKDYIMHGRGSVSELLD